MDKLITTSCEHCIFAKWADSLQIGCKLNRINKFGLDATLGEKYYTINRVCTTHRTQDWAKGKEDPVKDVLNEIKLKMGAIVYVDEQTDEEVRTTLTSLVYQSLQPKSLVLCYKNDKKPIHYMSILRELLDNTKIDYKLERIIDLSLTKEDCLDKSFSRLKNIYCVVFEAGLEIKPIILSSFNKFINKECQICSLVLPTDNYNGLIIQNQLYKTVGGFGKIGLINKIQILEEEQKCQITKTWDQILKFNSQ